MLRQVSALFHDIKIAVGSVETNLNRSFVVAQNALFAGKRLQPQKAVYDYRDYEFAYALSKIQDLKVSQGVLEPVSYTHLDVYKRQSAECPR